MSIRANDNTRDIVKHRLLKGLFFKRRHSLLCQLSQYNNQIITSKTQQQYTIPYTILWPKKVSVIIYCFGIFDIIY